MRPPHSLHDKRLALLAYHLWELRGRPIGSPDVDWFAAIRLLGESPGEDLAIGQVNLAPYEGPWR
jgi:DUF2934 family protein